MFVLLTELLEYVQENARDVADAAMVADIRRMERGDSWRGHLIANLHKKYDDEINEAQFGPKIEL